MLRSKIQLEEKIGGNANPIANKNGWKFCFTCQNDDTLVRNRDTLMILFKGYLTMYHYGECSDYQNVVRKVRWNNDTMILFSKKKLFVRKFEKALCGAFSNKTCHIFIASTASPCPSRHP